MEFNDKLVNERPDYPCPKCKNFYPFDDLMIFVHTQRSLEFHKGELPASFFCPICSAKIPFPKVEQWVKSGLGHTSTKQKKISSIANGKLGGRPKNATNSIITESNSISNKRTSVDNPQTSVSRDKQPLPGVLQQ